MYDKCQKHVECLSTITISLKHCTKTADLLVNGLANLAILENALVHWPLVNEFAPPPAHQVLRFLVNLACPQFAIVYVHPFGKVDVLDTPM